MDDIDRTETAEKPVPKKEGGKPSQPGNRDRNRQAAQSAKRGGSLFPWVLVVALLSFSAGMIMNPWFEREVRTRLPGVAQEADLGAVSARLEQQQSNLTQLDTRVAALEQRPAPLAGSVDTSGAAPIPAPAQNDDEPPALNDPVAPALAANLASDRVARVESRVDAMDRQQAAISGRVDNLSAEVAGLTVRVEDSRGEATSRMAEAERMASGARAVLLLGRARAAFE
ncbi:MAG: hypothetical protein WA979_04340, partial [Pacificimonas sp.]